MAIFVLALFFIIVLGIYLHSKKSEEAKARAKAKVKEKAESGHFRTPDATPVTLVEDRGDDDIDVDAMSLKEFAEYLGSYDPERRAYVGSSTTGSVKVGRASTSKASTSSAGRKSDLPYTAILIFDPPRGTRICPQCGAEAPQGTTAGMLCPVCGHRG